MTYVSVSLQHLSVLNDGDLVLVSGLYSRHVDGVVLTQGELRLPLLGEPFSFLPAQHAHVEVWGQLLQGRPHRLLVHDARPTGAAFPAPQASATGRVGDDLTLIVRVTTRGEQQLAVAPDRRTYLLAGEDLDNRLYLLLGRLVSLSPPMLSILQAVPVTLSGGTSTSAGLA